MVTPILLLHIAATLFMTGLIWFVQIVHYPLFAAVEPAIFPGYARMHQRYTFRVVAPGMLLEAMTGFLLLGLLPPGPLRAAAVAGAVLLTLVWLSTAFVQMPAHRCLERSFDPSTHQKLCRTNWFRTAAWTVRSVLVLLILQGVNNAS